MAKNYPRIPLFTLAKIYRSPILSPFPPSINDKRPLRCDRIGLELVILARQRFKARLELLEARLTLVLS